MTLGFHILCDLVLVTIVAMHVEQSSDMIPFMSWQDLTNPVYKEWGYGFPSNTTLQTLLPRNPGIEDYFHKLLYVGANGDADELWSKVSEAHADGHLAYDPQLVAVAYVFYVCRQLMGRLEFCPAPCKAEPCAGTGCSSTGNGLFSTNYRCQCPVHHHWHPRRLRCVFCDKDGRWNEARLSCEFHPRHVKVFRASQAPPSFDPSRWDAWSAWTACSNTCGAGKRVRRRSCRVHDPDACVGAASASQTCRGDSSCYNKPFVYTVTLLILGGFGVAIALVTLSKGDDPRVSAEDVDRAKAGRKKRCEKKKKRRASLARKSAIHKQML